MKYLFVVQGSQAWRIEKWQDFHPGSYERWCERTGLASFAEYARQTRLLVQVIPRDEVDAMAADAIIIEE